MDTEILNEARLNKLCKEFNFEQPKLLGSNLIAIKSKHDLWYLPNFEFYAGKTNIKLLHANAYGKAGYHFQERFKTYEAMFQYIASHDNKYTLEVMKR